LHTGWRPAESWWRLFERFKALSHTFWIVPSGSLLRAYSRLMFGPWRIPYIDALYFWPGNVDPYVGRAMMRRNFSNISVGVIQQVGLCVLVLLFACQPCFNKGFDCVGCLCQVWRRPHVFHCE
jgi:hypothetical protein